MVWKFAAHEGRARDLTTLLEMSATQVDDQPKCLFQHLEHDGREFRVHVGLEDAFAALTHVISFAEVLREARGVAQFEGVDVHGGATELAALRQPLAPFAPRYFERDAAAALF